MLAVSWQESVSKERQLLDNLVSTILHPMIHSGSWETEVLPEIRR